ncbi:MAG: peptidoglycan glycosyltransferase, partial [Lachnospiraceae bacterium]|nr:peptidoglycan glycosyltransferase [Lachnospiraceae bacterium]
MFVRTYQKKKILFFAAASILMLCALLGRLIYLMAVEGDYYAQMATNLQERERDIKALRGRILDRNGVVLADNETVCTVSVIYNQVEDPERVIQVLCEELDLEEEYVRTRVEKYSSRERILSNVPKETGDRIRAYDLAGVK